MPWGNDSINSLTIPTGATSGRRIVIDGVSGTITEYADDETIVFRTSINGLNRFISQYPGYPRVYISGFEDANPNVAKANAEVQFIFGLGSGGGLGGFPTVNRISVDYIDALLLENNSGGSVILNAIGDRIRLLHDDPTLPPVVTDDSGDHNIAHGGNTFTVGKDSTGDIAGLGFAAFTDVPGTSQTFDVLVDSHAQIVGATMWQITAAVSSVLEGVLNVDGADVTGQMQGSARTITRDQSTRSWNVALAAGSHTIKMRAKKTTNDGSTVNVLSPHTGWTGLIVPD